MLGSILGQKGDRSFKEDERAIEGLPIRLVIALVVGIAALTLMMGVLDTFSFGADTEVTVEYENPVVAESNSIEINVMDESGQEVTNSNVIVRGDTLNTEGVVSAQTSDDSNSVTIDIDDSSGDETVVPDWRSNQESGKLEVEVVPPSDGSFADEVENPKVTVLKD